MGKTYRYEKEWRGKKPFNKGKKNRKQRTEKVYKVDPPYDEPDPPVCEEDHYLTSDRKET